MVKSSVERMQRDYTMAWLSCPVLKRFRQFQDGSDGQADGSIGRGVR